MKWFLSGLTHCPSQGAFTPFSPHLTIFLTPPDPLQSFSSARLDPSPMIRSHPTNLIHLYFLLVSYVLYAWLCPPLCFLYICLNFCCFVCVPSRCSSYFASVLKLDTFCQFCWNRDKTYRQTDLHYSADASHSQPVKGSFVKG